MSASLVVGGLDSYTFTASANDKVIVRMSRTSGYYLNPEIRLYGPDGTQTCEAHASDGSVGQGGSSYTEISSCTLTSDGTYTIIASDYKGNASGDYSLTLLSLNAANATTIDCGQTASGSLDAIGEIDSYTFTADSNDAVVLTLTRTSGTLDPYLELLDSAGTKTASNYSTSGSPTSINQTLSTGGTYIIFASDYGNDETGKYTLKFQKNDNACPEVLLNAPNGGEIFEAGTTTTVTWSTSYFNEITSQKIELSTDGGESFSTVIATGLSKDTKSYTWNIPTTVHTAKGRIRVTITDSTGENVSDKSDDDFVILQSVSMSTIAYKYDKLNRLTQVAFHDGKSVAYAYDAVGNRTSIVSKISTSTTTPTLTATPGKTPTPTQECPGDGDVNEDGKLTAGDALLAFKSVLGSTTLTSCQQSHADVNGNGKVTAADALCIFKAVLKGESSSESLSCE